MTADDGSLEGGRMTGPGDGFLLGVDLGTSHTVAMLRHPDGRARPLLFDGQPLLPSAVFLDSGGKLHVGTDALRLGYADPGRLEPHPKRRVDDATIRLGPASVLVADLFAALLGAVAREAVATVGFLPPAVLTHPASWGETRRSVLVEALGKAGWPAGTPLVAEPVAAARYFAEVLRRPVPAGSSLAVFDFGAGTLDVAVVRNDGRAGFRVLASGGADDLGGLDLDAALVDHLGKSLAGAEPQAWHALTEPATLGQWRARRQFWDDVRGAKEMLSRSTFAPVPVPGVEHAVELTREELEAVADPLVRRGVAEAAAVIEAAGGELAGLFLVGGSTRVPLVARLLRGELGIAPTVLEQPELPVAEGATSEQSLRYAPGLATAATPTPTPATSLQAQPGLATTSEPVAATLPDPGTTPHGPLVATLADPGTTPHEPLAATLADPPAASRASGPASAMGQQGAGAGPPVHQSPTAITETPVDDGGDERLRAIPVDPWATGEAAALPTMADPFAAHQMSPPGGWGSPPSGAPGGLADGGLADGGLGNGGLGNGGSGSGSGANSNGNGGVHNGSIRDGDIPNRGIPDGGIRDGGIPNRDIPDGGIRHGGIPDRDIPDGGIRNGGGEPPASYAGNRGAGRTTPAGGPMAGVTTPEAAASRRGLFLRPYMMVVVFGVIVAVVAARVFWPGDRLDYHPLGEPRRVAAVVPVSSDWSDAEIIGDRVYFASSSTENGAVGVVAMDLGASKPAWTSLKAGTAARWKSMVALPEGVALFTDPDSTAGTRRIAVLDAGSGDLRWERTIADDDEVFFAGKTAVVTDHASKRLLGLSLTNGSERWSRSDPAGTSSVAPTVLTVTTPKDLDGPATVSGRPYQPSLTDDPRIVEVGADKSVQVLNADTGKVEMARQNVADPGDEMVAHNGRLIVLQPDDQRIVSYDLKKLGEPRVLYTAQGQNARMKAVTPCGDDRVCFGEETGYDGKTDKVVALDVAGGKSLWQFPVADIDTLVPVGQAVVATSLAGQTTLIDDGGKQIWSRTGEAARLDGGNLLEFSKPLSRSPDNPAVAGRHLGDQAVPLGYLSDIRSDTCSWNTSILACAADKDFVLQEFGN